MKVAVLNITQPYNVDVYVCKNGTIANTLLLRLVQEHWQDNGRVGDMPEDAVDVENYLEQFPGFGTVDIHIQPLVNTVKLLKGGK